MAAEPTLIYLVKQVELALRSNLDELLRPAGITPWQYAALTVLERTVDLSAAELARYSFVTAQTVADLVTALEYRGLITRHRDPRNRRRLAIELTDEGRRLLDDYRGPVAEIEARMVDGLAPDEVEAFRRYLNLSRSALAVAQR